MSSPYPPGQQGQYYAPPPQQGGYYQPALLAMCFCCALEEMC
ncbi:hypothetical protein RO3G_00318 [Rhizopus delemar RA 99-880]|uniref:Cysteine-rich transmembrane CYSTM domain-containing protein n=1 Tax=Rhizopus delemar (strain RA 99-880 / ATCC MYA-4621 / FGSC 9543 / NRRL 43880) TaxID=246409 RepID=I1BHD4_RHIO9|nr:hypothetical protein RO3G_00318 [Rhizopus delemar RA 99-880]|eukprot:EIE75614.1 hypothetical protein RO3G_00318 [Rhizopus delemar RA 99-880]